MKTTTKYKLIALWLILLSFSLSGCEDFLETDAPLGQLPHDAVYANEATATAAVTSLYGKLRNEVLLTGSASGMGVLMGLYADELDYYGYPGDTYETFYLHNILAADPATQSIWDSAYSLIYNSNSVLEGLETSTGLTVELKRQLKGETLFVRGLVYFYLVNLFGDIPYPTATEYQGNSQIRKETIPEVYNRIKTDLWEAKSILGDGYPTGERIRANKAAVSALLARVFLYNGQWMEAETESSSIIANESLYLLETDLNKVFLRESSSAILQLKPKNEGSNTQEAATYIFDFSPPPFVALSPTLVEAMEPTDLRKSHWIGEVSDGSRAWYYPAKYKEQFNTGTTIEYSIIFRLAEQYLIRAEARANQNNITGAQQDLNAIRNRAGLENTTASTQGELKLAILRERRLEMFAEQGHRWFDIRRLGMANEILAPIKSGWKATDILLPIPESEILLNPNLEPQNPGY